MDGIVASPILDEVLGGEGSGPGDPDGIEFLRRGEVEDDPLRVRGVGFVSEALGEVGIALPVGGRIAVGEARVPGIAGAVVAGESAMRQSVTVGHVDGLTKSGRSGEVAFALRIAPGSFGVPVPGLDEELGVLAVAHGLPAGGENLVEGGLGEKRVEGLGGETIDASAESG